MPIAREIGTIGVEQNRPMRTPGVANFDRSDATARSQPATSWQPAAVATPSTLAMTGCGPARACISIEQRLNTRRSSARRVELSRCPSAEKAGRRLRRRDRTDESVARSSMARSASPDGRPIALRRGARASHEPRPLSMRLRARRHPCEDYNASGRPPRAADCWAFGSLVRRVHSR